MCVCVCTRHPGKLSPYRWCCSKQDSLRKGRQNCCRVNSMDWGDHTLELNYTEKTSLITAKNTHDLPQRWFALKEQALGSNNSELQIITLLWRILMKRVFLNKNYMYRWCTVVPIFWFAQKNYAAQPFSTFNYTQHQIIEHIRMISEGSCDLRLE